MVEVVLEAARDRFGQGQRLGQRLDARLGGPAVGGGELLLFALIERLRQGGTAGDEGRQGDGGQNCAGNPGGLLRHESFLQS